MLNNQADISVSFGSNAMAPRYVAGATLFSILYSLSSVLYPLFSITFLHTHTHTQVRRA